MLHVCLTAYTQDFGLSVHISPHATHISHFSVGTPFYVAPEVGGWVGGVGTNGPSTSVIAPASAGL